MPDRQVRPLRPDDLPELVRLEEEVFARSGESVLGAVGGRRLAGVA